MAAAGFLFVLYATKDDGEIRSGGVLTEREEIRVEMNARIKRSER